MDVRKFLIFTISLSVLAIAEAGNQSKKHIDDPAISCLCAKPEVCGSNGPAVRFPFSLVGENHPKNRSYNSSYNLQCDQQNRTILKLSSSSRNALEVISIDYSSQRLIAAPLESCFAKHIQDQRMACLAEQLKDLDITKSPFQYYITDAYDYEGIFSVFNCSVDDGPERVHYLLTRPANLTLWGYASRISNCTKMYETNLMTWNIAQKIVSMMDNFTFFGNNSTELSWSEPPCGSCEKRNGCCIGKISDPNQVDCLGGNTSGHGVWKILGVSGPVIGCFLLVPAVGAIFFLQSKMEEQKEKQKRITKFLEDYAAVKPTRYSYADLKKITNNFKNKLGAGAYGDVFKGQIAKNIFVAVKLLHNSSGNGEEFINEVGTIGTIHHVNVVRLLGFCADGFKRALLYEFLPNGSLDKFIFPDGDQEPDHVLGMRKFEDIAIGIARGIEYLHQGCQQRILHFDIKPHNILLDKNYCPKISDFGLSKLCEKEKSVVSMTTARGTMGYIAPEVFSRQFGNVSYKSDIYSFGMLLLEMVGRRKNIDAAVQNMSQVYFPEWVYDRLFHGEELRIQIEEDGEEEIARRLAIVGLWCIQWNPIDRPSMSSVLQMLKVNGDNLSLPSNPFTSSNAVNPPLAPVYESE